VPDITILYRMKRHTSPVSNEDGGFERRSRNEVRSLQLNGSTAKDFYHVALVKGYWHQCQYRDTILHWAIARSIAADCTGLTLTLAGFVSKVVVNGL